MPQVTVDLTDILERLALSECGSCTCTTKTPEPEHHAGGCRYRLLRDVAAEIALERKLRVQASEDSQMHLDRALAAEAANRQLLTELQDAKALLSLYRELVGRIAIAADARAALQDMRCWWGKENKLRIAMDLPEREGRAFLGR